MQFSIKQYQKTTYGREKCGGGWIINRTCKTSIFKLRFYFLIRFDHERVVFSINCCTFSVSHYFFVIMVNPLMYPFATLFWPFGADAEVTVTSLTALDPSFSSLKTCFPPMKTVSVHFPSSSSSLTTSKVVHTPIFGRMSTEQEAVVQWSEVQPTEVVFDWKKKDMMLSVPFFRRRALPK